MGFLFSKDIPPTPISISAPLKPSITDLSIPQTRCNLFKGYDQGRVGSCFMLSFYNYLLCGERMQAVLPWQLCFLTLMCPTLEDRCNLSSNEVIEISNFLKSNFQLLFMNFSYFLTYYNDYFIRKGDNLERIRRYLNIPKDTPQYDILMAWWENKIKSCRDNAIIKSSSEFTIVDVWYKKWFSFMPHTTTMTRESKKRRTTNTLGQYMKAIRVFNIGPEGAGGEQLQFIPYSLLENGVDLLKDVVFIDYESFEKSDIDLSYLHDFSNLQRYYNNYIIEKMKDPSSPEHLNQPQMCIINTLNEYHNIPERFQLNNVNYSLDGGILHVSYYDFENKKLNTGPTIHPLLRKVMDSIGTSDIQNNSIFLIERTNANYIELNNLLDTYSDAVGPHALCGYKCEGEYHIMNSYDIDQTGYRFDWFRQVINQGNVLIRFNIEMKPDGSISKPIMMVYRPFNMYGTTLFYINDTLEVRYQELLERTKAHLMNPGTIIPDVAKPYFHKAGRKRGAKKKKGASRKSKASGAK